MQAVLFVASSSFFFVFFFASSSFISFIQMSAKIFVGGLNWDTSDEAFKAFFAPFGEIEESMVMRHRETGTSRGFGFVVLCFFFSSQS